MHVPLVDNPPVSVENAFLLGRAAHPRSVSRPNIWRPQTTHPVHLGVAPLLTADAPSQSPFFPQTHCGGCDIPLSVPVAMAHPPVLPLASLRHMWPGSPRFPRHYDYDYPLCCIYDEVQGRESREGRTPRSKPLPHAVKARVEALTVCKKLCRWRDPLGRV